MYIYSHIKNKESTTPFSMSWTSTQYTNQSLQDSFIIIIIIIDMVH